MNNVACLPAQTRFANVARHWQSEKLTIKQFRDCLALPKKANDDGSWEIDIDKFLKFFDLYFGWLNGVLGFFVKGRDSIQI